MLLSVKIIRLFGESKMALSIMFTTELLFYPAFCIHILHYAFYTHHHTHSIAYTIHSVLHVSDQKLKNELLNRQTRKTYFKLLFKNFFEK